MLAAYLGPDSATPSADPLAPLKAWLPSDEQDSMVDVLYAQLPAIKEAAGTLSSAAADPTVRGGEDEERGMQLWSKIRGGALHREQHAHAQPPQQAKHLPSTSSPCTCCRARAVLLQVQQVLGAAATQSLQQMAGAADGLASACENSARRGLLLRGWPGLLPPPLHPIRHALLPPPQQPTTMGTHPPTYPPTHAATPVLQLRAWLRCPARRASTVCTTAQRRTCERCKHAGPNLVRMG